MRMREKVTDRLSEMRLRERERVRATPRADRENESFSLQVFEEMKEMKEGADRETERTRVS